MTEQEFNLLHAYQQQNLRDKEKTDLEEKLQLDPYWQKLWADFQLLQAGIRAAGDDQLRSSIQQANLKFQQKRARRRLVWRLIAMASILLLLVFLTWNYIRLQKIQKLERTYYTGPQALLSQQLDSLEMRAFGNMSARENTALLKGLQAIEQKNYPQAIQQLQGMQHNPEAHIARFFLGLAYLRTQQHPQAIQLWEQLRPEAPQSLQQVLRYELSWAYARQPRTHQQAKRLWQQIAGDPTDPHQAEIQQLLQDLD